MDVNAARLCYLAASKVTGPSGMLDALDVRTPRNHSLGSVDGVLIDPAERKLRFLVVEPSERLDSRRYLLPLDGATTINPDGHSLHIEMERDDFTALDQFDMAAVRAFTDEDAIAPTFARYLS